MTDLHTAAKQALEALEKAVIAFGPGLTLQERAITALRQALASAALDKMAENARELGIQMQPEEPRAWFTVDELNAWANKKLEEKPQWAEQPQMALKTCCCRWNEEVQVQQCTLHEAHANAIHEWAERAKTAEAKLKEKSHD